MKVGGLIPLVPLALAALASAGCAGTGTSAGFGTGAGGSMGTGTGGVSGFHCTTAACVPPLSAHLSWAVEIDPSSGQSSAAIRELPVDLYGAGSPLDLMAAQSTTIGITFNAPAGVSVPSAANVVLTVPAIIPGRPALTFQAPTVLASTSTSSATFAIPSDRLGTTASMALVPLPSADQVSPPRSFSVVLADGLSVSLPNDDLVVNGTLLSAIAKAPTSTFVARAFQGGTQVSSAPPTQADGTFRLVLPSAAVTAANPLTIQLTPQTQSDPWFVSNPISFPLSPTTSSYGPVMLPAYSNLNQFNLAVRSAADSSANVSGAVVRAQTTVGTSSLGTTQFARSGTTDANGIASLSLLPGTATATLAYAIAVTPPVNSVYASQCVASVEVTSGGSTVNSASAPTLTTVMLAFRPQLTGTVTDSQGYPLANVSITATPGPAASGTCTAAATSPSNTTTDTNGMFGLPLDPGTYQLDYDPPPGSAAPRFTELGVQVSGSGAAQILHNLTLPAGGLVKGIAIVPGGSQPLSSATIRIFEPRCTGAGCTTPPWLRGQTVTDGNGQFQIVVPLPQ